MQPMRRLSARVLCLAALLAAASLWLTLFLSGCSSQASQSSQQAADDNFHREFSAEHPQAQSAPKQPLSELDCVINDEYTVSCRKEGTEVFLPFSFVSKYFEVYGKMVEEDGLERFEWKHSYSKVYKPDGKYSPDGIFMSFEHYNVEIRDRVKCISAIEGVPLSTQWGPQGYYYPIQIAQYGLSHFSKYLVDQSQKKALIEDAEADVSKWRVLGDSVVRTIWDSKKYSNVVAFQSDDSSAGVHLAINSQAPLFFLSLNLKLLSNASITVIIETKGKQPQLYSVHYVSTRTLITSEGHDVYYGIGEASGEWHSFTRDLSTDLHKGLALKSKGKKSRPGLLRVVSISMSGRGQVDNITMASNVHLPQFYAAADWLVRHQDGRGGWPIHVERVLANGLLHLDPGWYSAMAQGQAMSLLVRAFTRTKKKQYLEAALRATALFDVPASDGGVMAMFSNHYVWYEEYPTTPSSFVLNGFMYSLIGLYDLQHTVTDARGADALRLYTQGMQSLKAMLPLFDTGSGSVYDLRHFTIGVAPNLARWDYHTTHINQLLLLATVDQRDSVLTDIASRWTSYMHGHRAPHN